MSKLRRYELLLPKRFNDGSAVPQEAFADVGIELRNRFGAFSWKTRSVLGRWLHEGVEYEDESICFYVDVADTAANRRWVAAFKKRLKDRFQQIDLWITTYVVETV